MAVKRAGALLRISDKLATADNKGPTSSGAMTYFMID